jgi:hypothetical protein
MAAAGGKKPANQARHTAHVLSAGAQKESPAVARPGFQILRALTAA